jgi:glycosyltransferase involved in cell wall biosynthesis
MWFMFDISVVIPVRDEEPMLAALIDRLCSTLDGMNKTYEIVFVTDINRDNTVGLLEAASKANPAIKTLRLSNSFGQHVAVVAGLDHCSGEYIVIMDGDLQDLPEDIPRLYAKIGEGYDVVYAIKNNKNGNALRNVSSWFFNLVMGYLSDVHIDSNSSMFRIISRKALQAVLSFREAEPSLTYIFSFINLPTTTMSVRSGSRQGGVTKYGLPRLAGHALKSLMSFSTRPLRLISGLGFLMSAASFSYFAIVLVQHFLGRILIFGWTTLVVVITLLGGIQLLSIGIIGEYVGRMYMQTKNRPLYIVQEKYGQFDK